ncbi:MAG: hypothetical protein WAT78_04940 [Rhizobiaceae bacterium]
MAFSAVSSSDTSFDEGACLKGARFARILAISSSVKIANNRDLYFVFAVSRFEILSTHADLPAIACKSGGTFLLSFWVEPLPVTY